MGKIHAIDCMCLKHTGKSFIVKIFKSSKVHMLGFTSSSVTERNQDPS